MVETRVLLEMFAWRQAAFRSNEKNIKDMEEVFNQYRMRVESDLSGVNEDFNFHLKIAEASQNMVIKTLM